LGHDPLRCQGAANKQIELTRNRLGFGRTACPHDFADPLDQCGGEVRILGVRFYPFRLDPRVTK
jgi:hypothetical protein